MTTTELKKPPPFRLVERAQMQNGLVPHPGVVDKNLVGITQKQGVPAPYQDPQPMVTVPGRLSTHNFWLQNTAGVESVKRNF